MSKCPSTSSRKRKLQTTVHFDRKKPAKKKMAWDSYNSIEDFGYKFNDEGRLVDTETGDGFNFYVSEEHYYNQQNYEMLGEIITEHVYGLLQSEDVGLIKLEIPLEKDSSQHLSFRNSKQDKKQTAKGFIFVSKDFDKQDKLMILVHGSGVVRAGQWARRLIINDCLDHGTQIPYIKQAIKEGYGVVVTNTNQDEVVVVQENGKRTYKTIKESESPERHYSYVWKNIIEKTKASKLFLVGHSYGGYLIVDYFSRNAKVLDRVVAVAFTDSVHSLNSHSKAQVRQWFLKNSVNWVTSSSDLGTPMSHQDYHNGVPRVSAGTTKHEETSWKAMECVFNYFRSHEVDFKRPNKKSTSGTGKSGGQTNIANFHNKIVKEVNQGSTPTLLALSEEEKHKSNCEQMTEGTQMSSNQKSDGMNSYLEDTQEKSEGTSEEKTKETDKEGKTSNETCMSASEQDEISPTTEAGDKASDEVKPTTSEDQCLHATFISSTSSEGISTPGEKTPNEIVANLKDNVDTMAENEQSGMNSEDMKQSADPRETDASNSEPIKKIVVEAKDVKVVVETALGMLSSEPNNETPPNNTGDASSVEQLKKKIVVKENDAPNESTTDICKEGIDDEKSDDLCKHKRESSQDSSTDHLEETLV